MKTLRYATGIVLMLSAAVGLIASLAAIYGINRASTTTSKQSVVVLDSTRDAVVFLERGTTKIQVLLGETKARTLVLEATLEDVAKKVQDSPSGKTPLSALDERIANQLRRSQATVAALQSTLEGFQSTLVLFNSLQGLSKSRPSANEKSAHEGQELSQSLTEATELMEQISRFLNEFMNDREVTQKNLTELTARVKQVQSRLTEAESRVGAFQQRLSATEEQISSARAEIPSLIEWGAVFAIVLLVCFAFTQIGLLLQARLLLRPPASP